MFEYCCCLLDIVLVDEFFFGVKYLCIFWIVVDLLWLYVYWDVGVFDKGVVGIVLVYEVYYIVIVNIVRV